LLFVGDATLGALWALPATDPARGRGEYTSRYTHLIARTLLISGLLLLVPTVRAQKTNIRSPHGPLAIPCENCHTATAWRPIRAVLEFDHNKTAYPLRGQHEKVRCLECHAKPVFTDVGKNCADCHADIHLRKFGADCAQCHTVLGWQVSINQIKEHQNRFPLFGAHAAVQCDDCHKSAAVGQFQGLSTQCVSCHLSDYQKTNNPPHAANTAIFTTTCDSCHSFDSWLNAKFDHSTTGFLLTQGHANVPCLSCHVGNNYHLTIAPTDCGNSGCHLNTWQTTNNPPHPTAGPVFAASNCANCHTTAGWNSANFNHASTGFALTNGHANVACAACHVNNNYNLQVAPSACGTSGCHLTTWQTTTQPVHSTSGPAFGLANCANCHTTAGWNAASFDHSITGFALVGTHSTTPCASCHTNNNYTLNSADCYGCHAAAFQSTTTIGGNVPNHITAGFPTTAAQCATCHPITTWAAGTFNHSATGFPLTGQHTAVACAQCHINGNFSLQIALNSCGNSQCHLTTWQGTNNPVHSTSGATFAVGNCANCHTTAGWDAASFDHSITGFALTGTHFTTPCASCHTNNNYTLNSADCYGCHAAAFQSTTTIGGSVPNHITAGFPTTAAQCASCHPITTWAAGTFNHSATGFPLTGQHTTVACAQCHINGNFSLQIALNSCGNSQCHLTTWQGTNNPVHSTSGAAFAVGNCSNCHTTAGWDGASFDHSATGFALTGTHSTTPCASCHTNNNYTLNSADCYGCHAAAFQSTTTIGGNVPNHVTAGFPTTAAQCASCHPITTWAAGTFNHTTTGFPLTGQHTTVTCALCHINGNFSLQIALNSCGNSQCHLTTWQGTNNPVHSTAGAAFAVGNCSNCHTTAGWDGASFDHSATGFALTGTHATTPCASCHTNNNYTLNSADCYGCHAAAFQSTTTIGGNVPNHVSAGFPTTAAQCASCHPITTWAAGTFNHSTTGFTLVGTHLTTACAACHINGNYTLNSADCYGCHAAAFQSTTTIGGNVPNHVTAGFPTTAAPCATCHPITTWAAGTFNHNTTAFPLTGAHVTTACSACHVNNNYSGTLPTDCYGCHLTAWQSTFTLGGAVPNHMAANFSTNCATSGCHNTTSWLGVTFNHQAYWQLPHQGAVCGDCHIDQTTYVNTSCINCHTRTAHDKTSTDSSHRGRNGYSYGPMTCLASGCHLRGP
jgi:hypothetical protein